MARKLEIQIVGDTRDYERALAKASKDTQGFGKTVGGMGQTAKLAAVAGIGAVTVGLKKSADAAMEAEESQARMETALKSTGISYDKHKDQIDSVIQSTSKLAGLDDEELQNAFTAVTRATGDVTTGLKDTQLAADLARGAHVSLTAATKAITNAELGRATNLRKYGVVVETVTDQTDAMKQAYDRYKATHKDVSTAEKDHFENLIRTAK
jgi:hypothetical protein